MTTIPIILIVDDNHQNLQLAAHILKQKGYRISLALNWKEAENLMNIDKPDLILLDVMMPEIDGFTACKEIKKNSIFEDIPIIFLTAKSDADSITEGFRSGGADYINKPFMEEELIARVANQLNLKLAKEELYIKNIELEKSLLETDQLLNNVLPLEIVKELKQTGKSNPKLYKNVTLMATDFVNFTEISTRISPFELIQSLNSIYSEFDNIINSNNCIRIKTVGDAYLAISGLPDDTVNHPDNMFNAARDILKFIKNKPEEYGIKWKIRIALHSGEIIGGIVGTEKYIYDIFGDSVNTVFRLQAEALENSIIISEICYNSLSCQNIGFDKKQYNLKGKGIVTGITITSH